MIVYINITLSLFLYLVLREDHTAGLQATEIKCFEIMTWVIKYKTIEVENQKGQEKEGKISWRCNRFLILIGEEKELAVYYYYYYYYYHHRHHLYTVYLQLYTWNKPCVFCSVIMVYGIYNAISCDKHFLFLYSYFLKYMCSALYGCFL